MRCIPSESLQVMGETESGFFEFVQEVGAISRQDFQTLLLVRLHLRDLDDNAREFSYFRVVRFSPRTETGHVSLRYVRLTQETEDRVLLFDGIPVLLWKKRTLFTHVDLVPPARESFMGARFPAYAAVVSHGLESTFFRRQAACNWRQETIST